MNAKLRNILIIFGLFLAVVLLVDFNRRMEELDRLTEQLHAVRAEATAVIQTQNALAGQVAYATSDVAVEEWSYENSPRHLKRLIFRKRMCNPTGKSGGNYSLGTALNQTTRTQVRFFISS
jgi:hypothetical protein